MSILDELNNYIIENHEVDIDELKDFYEKRTKKHIDLVNKYCDRIKKKFDEFSDVDFKEHDKSKFEEPEYTPYVYMTWKYKVENDGNKYVLPDGMNDKIKMVWEHHYLNNKHHPEYWVKDNKKLDKLKKPYDCYDMDNISIAEMVADWCAMSEELGKNTPKEWADSNIGKRWKFTEAQQYLIYDLIDSIWRTK